MLKKRVLPVILVAFVLLGIMLTGLLTHSFTSFAAEQITTVSGEDNFEITQDGTAKILTGIKDSAVPADNAEFNLVIPDGVTAIGSSALKNASVASVTFPASLKTIRASAFENCYGLTSVSFADGAEGIEFEAYSFASCKTLKKIDLPALSVVKAHAFNSCSQLLLIYAGSGTTFVNAGESGAPFFSGGASFMLVFSDKADYDKAVADGSDFKAAHSVGYATYKVSIKRHIGSTSAVVEDLRLYGKNYNFVFSEEFGDWVTNDAITDLPAQADHYFSTVWYSDEALTKTVSINDVNAMLREAGQEINLYCHDTVAKPSLPAEPVAWVYDSKISYDVKDLKSVLKAMGCTTEYTDAQLAALKYEIKYTDSDAKEAELPDTICNDGVYGVTISLNPAYGVWREDTVSTVTVNVNTSPFNVVLIILIIVGALAVAVTVTTAIIRKKVQARAKRKQISQKEILERFRATGEETTLK